MKTRLIVVLLGIWGLGMFIACRDDASDKDDDRPGKAVELENGANVTQNYRQALLTEVGKWSNGAYQANMLDGNAVKQIFITFAGH